MKDPVMPFNSIPLDIIDAVKKDDVFVVGDWVEKVRLVSLVRNLNALIYLCVVHRAYGVLHLLESMYDYGEFVYKIIVDYAYIKGDFRIVKEFLPLCGMDYDLLVVLRGVVENHDFNIQDRIEAVLLSLSVCKNAGDLEVMLEMLDDLRGEEGR